MGKINLRLYNADNNDIYVSVYDELSKESILDDEFLSEDGTFDITVAESDNSGIISWQCYRRDDESKRGGASHVEVTAMSTVDVQTDI